MDKINHIFQVNNFIFLEKRKRKGLIYGWHRIYTKMVPVMVFIDLKLKAIHKEIIIE